MSTLANWIRHLRGDLSQLEFARKVGLSHRTITKIENGDKPKRANVVKIADKLHLDRNQRKYLLWLWAKEELGQEADGILIDGLKSPAQSDTLLLLQGAVANLREADQRQLLLVCDRPVILKLIPRLNDFYDLVT